MVSSASNVARCSGSGRPAAASRMSRSRSVRSTWAEPSIAWVRIAPMFTRGFFGFLVWESRLTALNSSPVGSSSTIELTYSIPCRSIAAP